MTAPNTDIVTFLIRHRVNPEHRERYEAWLRAIGQEAARFPGHLGTSVVRPVDDSHPYTIIVRFDHLDHLTAWAESDIRRARIREVEPILVGGDRVEVKSGIDFWFTPALPGVKAPNHFKQFLITFSAIYPLTLLVPAVLSPLFSAFPALDHILLSRLLIAAIIVWLMVYVVMPRYTRAVADWLYR
jgi:antibiotic biosynthesis monooxygenase (ABM) superfamily enzyme